MPRNIRINERNSIEDVLKGNVNVKKIVKKTINNEQKKEKSERPIFPTLRSVRLDRLKIIKDHYHQTIDDGMKIVGKINKATDEETIIFYENQLEKVYERLDILDHQEQNELHRIKAQIFDNLNSIRHYHKRLENYLNDIENYS